MGNNPILFADPTGHMRTDENGSSKRGCSDSKYCYKGKPKKPPVIQPSGTHDVPDYITELLKKDPRTNRHECMVACHAGSPDLFVSSGNTPTGNPVADYGLVGGAYDMPIIEMGGVRLTEDHLLQLATDSNAPSILTNEGYQAGPLNVSLDGASMDWEIGHYAVGMGLNYTNPVARMSGSAELDMGNVVVRGQLTVKVEWQVTELAALAAAVGGFFFTRALLRSPVRVPQPNVVY